MRRLNRKILRYAVAHQEPFQAAFATLGWSFFFCIHAVLYVGVTLHSMRHPMLYQAFSALAFIVIGIFAVMPYIKIQHQSELVDFNNQPVANAIIGQAFTSQNPYCSPTNF